jgi:hypothetical protein
VAQLKAVHFRHVDIRKDNVGAESPDKLQAGFTVHRGLDLVPVILEFLPHQVQQVDLVLDQSDSSQFSLLWLNWANVSGTNA